jgi:Domain of unknown function (DUF3850)
MAAPMKPPTVHELKMWPVPFDAVLDGSKGADVRRCDDRQFVSGDLLLFRCWKEKYFDRCLLARITNVTRYAGELDLYVVDSVNSNAPQNGGQLVNFIGFPAAVLSFYLEGDVGTYSVVKERAAALRGAEIVTNKGRLR